MPSRCSASLPRRPLPGKEGFQAFPEKALGPAAPPGCWGAPDSPGVVQPGGQVPTTQWRKLPKKHQILLPFHHYWPVLKTVTEKRKVPFPITRYPIPLENIC